MQLTDSLHCANLIDVLHPFLRFYLHDQKDISIRSVNILLGRIQAMLKACKRTTLTADTDRGELGQVGDRARLLSCADHGYKKTAELGQTAGSLFLELEASSQHGP